MSEVNFNPENFSKKYPSRRLKLRNGKIITYRYYKNHKQSESVFLLPGEIGISDVFCCQFEKLTEKFTVITADFGKDFDNVKEFSQGAVSLLNFLDEKPWLAGQSLGGVIAQLMVMDFPECAAGIIFSDTVALTERDDSDTVKIVEKFSEYAEKLKKKTGVVPFPVLRHMARDEILKRLSGKLTESEMANAEKIALWISKKISRHYLIHMSNVIYDIRNYFNKSHTNFLGYRGKVLVTLSDDDRVFGKACSEKISCGMEGTTQEYLRYGYPRQIVRTDEYVEVIATFIENNIKMIG